MRTIFALTLAASCLCAQETFSGASDVDAQINGAVQSHLIPGAVLVIGHNGQVD